MANKTAGEVFQQNVTKIDEISKALSEMQVAELFSFIEEFIACFANLSIKDQKTGPLHYSYFADVKNGVVHLSIVCGSKKRRVGRLFFTVDRALWCIMEKSAEQTLGKINHDSLVKALRKFGFGVYEDQ